MDRIIVPNPDHAPVYDELFGAYGALYAATREQVHLLARMQEGQARLHP